MIGQIEKSSILVVEGKDEEQFFQSLLRHLNIERIQILPLGGKTQLKDNLNAIKSLTGYDDVNSIGIVRDANGNRKGAFDSVCSALKGADLPVPDNPLIPVAGDPKVTVMIMPPEENMGTGRMLEDLCYAAVAEDRAIKCVKQYFECLEEQGLSLPDNAIAKARIHAFLASRKEPDLRLGEAAQKGYWRWDNPAFDEVKAFLQQL
jgi:hypothetical protein